MAKANSKGAHASTQLHSLPIRREDDDGNVEYVDYNGEPYGHSVQVQFSRVDRYRASIEVARSKGQKITENKLPKDLEPEFYGPSVGDTLSAQTGVLAFLQDTLAMDSMDEPLTDSGVRGLFYILQGAIDNAEQVTAFLEALQEEVSSN